METTLQTIIQQVSTHLGVDPLLVYSRSRHKEESIARSIVVYFARKHTTMTATKIGILLSGRSHSTIVYYTRQVDEEMQVNRIFRKNINIIKLKILKTKCHDTRTTR